MIYYFEEDSKFAHIENESLKETLIPKGTESTILEMNQPYLSVTGELITRITVQVKGHRLPFVVYVSSLHEKIVHEGGILL